VLSDLVRSGALAVYRYGGEEYLLRSPLGIYLVPVLIGQIWGLWNGHLAATPDVAALWLRSP
jgi:hypothetical protein